MRFSTNCGVLQESTSAFWNEVLDASFCERIVIPRPVLDLSVGTCLTSGCHSGAGGHDQEILDCAPHVTGKMKCDESCHQ